MNNLEKNLDEEERQLKEQLARLPKKKWQIWRLILVGLLGPFILPYLPMKRGPLSERMGYEDSVLLFGGIYLLVIPIACYMHFQKVNQEMCAIESKLIRLKFKKSEITENDI
ncbi:hypothetical protein [Flavobacterium saliperosum]|uniref:DUF485 domain-containing protein n=1 Tax=Flavobacterium saliperosum TaxID=329186 RepID=A0A1G4W9T1_9FLAO|nr:hypothetical protein [Flavobacterium saliperosum]SCX19106.1 hypothetical protein SAMN02927925_02769 [Flavobacterium saliperosum]